MLLTKLMSIASCWQEDDNGNNNCLDLISSNNSLLTALADFATVGSSGVPINTKYITNAQQVVILPLKVDILLVTHFLNTWSAWWMILSWVCWRSSRTRSLSSTTGWAGLLQAVWTNDHTTGLLLKFPIEHNISVVTMHHLSFDCLLWYCCVPSWTCLVEQVLTRQPCTWWFVMVLEFAFYHSLTLLTEMDTGLTLLQILNSL